MEKVDPDTKGICSLLQEVMAIECRKAGVEPPKSPPRTTRASAE